MTSVVKRFLSLFIVAIFIGAGVPGVIFPVYIFAVVLLVLLLWVNAATVTNLPLYGMGGVLLVGSLCGKAGVVAFKDMSPEQWEWVVSWGRILFPFLGLGLLIVALVERKKYLAYRTENNKRVPAWKSRNLFLEREDDLARLLGYVKNPRVTTLGLEAEWGQGKSFLLAGLVEALEREKENPVEIVKIDVLAVRLDSFAEYLVQELNNVLYTNGKISSNMRKLQGIFKATKIHAVDILWADADKRYAKIFDEFRRELLLLRKPVLIIYEDLDRLQNVDAVKNILYLTEKLTAANDTVWQGGIKAIYQYDRQHMKDMGLTEQFMEKYVRCHMDLSPLSLRTMIQRMQKDTQEDFRLTGQEIWKLPMGSKYFVRCILDEEAVWVQRYLSKGITIRRTEDFLKSVETAFGWFAKMQPWERETIISFSYIEHFLPLAYARLKEAAVCDLYQVFRGYDDAGNEVLLVFLLQEYRNLEMELPRRENAAVRRAQIEQRMADIREQLRRLVDYRKSAEMFELYLALRLLKLDQVKLPEAWE